MILWSLDILPGRPASGLAPAGPGTKIDGVACLTSVGTGPRRCGEEVPCPSGLIVGPMQRPFRARSMVSPYPGRRCALPWAGMPPRLSACGGPAVAGSAQETDHHLRPTGASRWREWCSTANSWLHVARELWERVSELEVPRRGSGASVRLERPGPADQRAARLCELQRRSRPYSHADAAARDARGSTSWFTQGFRAAWSSTGPCNSQCRRRILASLAVNLVRMCRRSHGRLSSETLSGPFRRGSGHWSSVLGRARVGRGANGSTLRPAGACSRAGDRAPTVTRHGRDCGPGLPSRGVPVQRGKGLCRH